MTEEKDLVAEMMNRGTEAKKIVMNLNYVISLMHDEVYAKPFKDKPKFNQLVADFISKYNQLEKLNKEIDGLFKTWANQEVLKLIDSWIERYEDD